MINQSTLFTLITGTTTVLIAARYSASPRGYWELDQAMLTFFPSPGVAPEDKVSKPISFIYVSPVSSGAPVPGKKFPLSCRWIETYKTYTNDHILPISFPTRILPPNPNRIPAVFHFHGGCPESEGYNGGNISCYLPSPE